MTSKSLLVSRSNFIVFFVKVSFSKQPKYNSFGKFLIFGKFIWTVILSSSTFSWLLCLNINFPSNVSILFFFLLALGSKYTFIWTESFFAILKVFSCILKGSSVFIVKSASNKEAFFIVKGLYIVSLSLSSSFLYE